MPRCRDKTQIDQGYSRARSNAEEAFEVARRSSLMGVVMSRCARQIGIGHKPGEQCMARGVEMCISYLKWIHAGDSRLQEFRIRFTITDSQPGKTLCQQTCKRMILGQML